MGSTGATIGSGNGTNSVVVNGTLTQLNNLLAGLNSGTIVFNANSDAPPASATLTLLVDDTGDTGTGGALTASDTATINITAVNDAPTSANDSVATNEDITVILGLSDFGTYADPEGTPIASVRITTLETNGSLEFDTTGLGAWAAVTLNQDITAAHISAGRLRFVPDGNENGTPYTTVGFRVSDGVLLSTAAYTLTLNVTAVNDPPTATITPLSYNATEQVNLNLHGTGMSVADIDAGASVISITLSVGAGILTVVAGNSGVDSITGSGTSSVTVTGTVTDINNLLGGIDTGGGSAGTIVYNANVDAPPASTTLTLLVDDTGDTGIGGPLTASDVATINITAVNDAPVVSNVTATETSIGFSIADPDSSSFTLVNAPTAFATAFGNPALVLGSNSLSPTQQASVLSGTLQVTDGATPDTVAGLYLGTSAGNTATAPIAGSTNIMYGFAGNDTMTGSTAADFIFGGADTDTINLATGHFVAGELIDGGTGTDTVTLTTGGDGQSIDFTVGTLTNVENLTSVDGGGGSDHDQTFTLTAGQWAGLSSIDMNDGTDVLNVEVDGTVDISSLVPPRSLTSRRAISPAPATPMPSR